MLSHEEERSYMRYERQCETKKMEAQWSGELIKRIEAFIPEQIIKRSTKKSVLKDLRTLIDHWNVEHNAYR